MTKKIYIITIHGMGDKDQNFDKKLRKKVIKRLKGTSVEHNYKFRSFNYSSETQKNQDRVFSDMETKAEIGKWIGLRKFMLSSFSDPVAFLNQPERNNSAYKRIHTELKHHIDSIYADVNDDEEPILVVFASSLGCQVLSSYLWDASKNKGIWSSDNQPTGKQKLKDLRLFFTVGCNIPLFVSGEPIEKIVAFEKPNDNFKWLNYYDRDDVLGWPLKPLSPSYENLVDDFEVNTGWTPLSHLNYWKDKDVIKPFVKQIKEIFSDT